MIRGAASGAGDGCGTAGLYTAFGGVPPCGTKMTGSLDGAGAMVYGTGTLFIIGGDGFTTGARTTGWLMRGGEIV
jgi:hypothetical protein